VAFEQLVQRGAAPLFRPHDLVVPFMDSRRFLLEDPLRVLQVDPRPRVRALFAPDHRALRRIDGETRIATRTGNFDHSSTFGMIRHGPLLDPPSIPLTTL
jgi:hypothetical protein